MTALRLIAGQTAKSRIEAEGLTPDLVRMVVGASGGPKWLVLAGLDRFLFGSWLPQNEGAIDLVGSSIGAWRMCVAAHPEPAAAFERFISSYFEYRYVKGESAASITRNSYALLDRVFKREDAEKIVANTVRRLHIVAVRARGLAGRNFFPAQAVGLLGAALRNRINRDSLGHVFDRAVFHTGDTVALSEQWPEFGRLDIPLLPEALPDVLMASGSIPAVIDAIRDIKGAPEGSYRDGGITDYHFAIPWRLESGIILYPHFYPYLVPGWFDKSMPGRRAAPDVMDHMLVLAPSEEFVARLPGGTLTDRKNFTQLSEEGRLKLWQTVVDCSNALADEFQALLADPAKLMQRIETLS